METTNKRRKFECCKTMSVCQESPVRKMIGCFGFLTVLGYNGCLPLGNHGRQRSKFGLLEPPFKKNRFQLDKACVSRNTKSISTEKLSDEIISTIPTINYHEQVNEMKFGEVINFHKLGGKENDLFELNSSSAQYIYQIGRHSGETIDFVVRDKATIEWETRNHKLSYQTISAFPISNKNMDVITNDGDSPVILNVRCENENTEFPESINTTITNSDSFDSAIYLNPSATESTSNSNEYLGSDDEGSLGKNNQNTAPKSSISRYAFHIVFDRKSGKSYVFAGGFADPSFRIVLGKKDNTNNANNGDTKKKNIFTSNGVLLWKPKYGFMEGDKIHHSQKRRNEISFWGEVSIHGKMYYHAKYESRDRREINHEEKIIEMQNNLLVDGSLIDVCGATLLYRTQYSLAQGPSIENLFQMIDRWNGENYVCSVSFLPLFLRFELQADDLFGSRDTILSSLSPISPEAFKKTPFFFSQCGHVFGPYKWTKEPSKQEEYKCPICNRNGQVVKLSMGMEPSFWLDTSNPTHAFTNCGHMASEKTIRYWLSVGIPQGQKEFVAKCPFCGTEVTDEIGFVKLLYPCNADAV